MDPITAIVIVKYSRRLEEQRVPIGEQFSEWFSGRVMPQELPECAARSAAGSPSTARAGHEGLRCAPWAGKDPDPAVSAVPRPTGELPSQGPLPCACHDGMDFLANGIFIFSLAPLIISVRETPPATRLPSILRGRRATPELRPCRRGARRHPTRRRPPHPHAREPSPGRAARSPPSRRAPQPPGAGLLRGGPPHPPRHPRHHRAPRRPQAPARALEPASRRRRGGARTCLQRANVR